MRLSTTNASGQLFDAQDGFDEMNKHHQASHVFVFTHARHERRGSDWTIENLGGVEISSFSHRAPKNGSIFECG